MKQSWRGEVEMKQTLLVGKLLLLSPQREYNSEKQTNKATTRNQHNEKPFISSDSKGGFKNTSRTKSFIPENTNLLF